MSEKYANKENLERFWSKAKEYIGNERQEIEDQLYNWQKTEKAPIVQWEPVPNSELHPTVEFKFKEILPEGEKSPDNPSTITGVNSITITKTGKNLIGLNPAFHSRTTNGITFTVNDDGTCILNGTATSSFQQYIWTTSTSPVNVKSGLTYTLTGCPAGLASSTFSLRVNLENTVYADYGDGKTFTPQKSGPVNCYINIFSGATASNLVFKPQLEFGSIATSYEPPVLATATVNFNETYYGGSIDLSTGLMTVTQFSETLDPSKVQSANITIGTNTVGFLVDLSIQHKGSTSNGVHVSNRFVFENNGNDFEHFRGVGPVTGWHTIRVFINKSRLDLSEAVDSSNPTEAEYVNAFVNWLTDNSVFVVVDRAIPIAVQLTPQQIKSLPSLEGTSKRINTIYTDADSVQVEYQKYVGIDSTLDSDSVNAIQNKTVNSALNTKVSLSGDEIISGTKTFSNTINGSITGDAGTVAGHIVSKDVPVNAAFTDTTYDPATQSTAGLMSASDKTKLDAVGSVFSFKGSVVNSSSLPVSSNANGDAYLAEDTGHVHVYNGSSFVDIGVWAGIPSATDAQIDALFED